MSIEVETCIAPHMSDADHERLAELRALIFPRPGRTPASILPEMRDQYRSFDGDPARSLRRFLVRDDAGQIIANADILPRTIATAEGQFGVGGLKLVLCHPDYQGRGLGAAVVRAAFGLIDRGVFPWSLFQTSRRIQPFYEHLRCRLVDNVFVNSENESNPRARPWKDEVVMIYPADRAGWPEGEIDLLGPYW